MISSLKRRWVRKTSLCKTDLSTNNMSNTWTLPPTHTCSGVLSEADWAVFWKWTCWLWWLSTLNSEANQCLLCGNPSGVCRVRWDGWLTQACCPPLCSHMFHVMCSRLCVFSQICGETELCCTTGKGYCNQLPLCGGKELRNAKKFWFFFVVQIIHEHFWC